MHFLWRSPCWGTLCVQLQPGSHTELQRASATGVQDTLEVNEGQGQVRVSCILYRLSLQRSCSCGLPICSHRLCTQRLSSQLEKTVSLLSNYSRVGGPVTSPPRLFCAIPLVPLLWMHVCKENVSTFFQLLFVSVRSLRRSWARRHTPGRHIYHNPLRRVTRCLVHGVPLWTHVHRTWHTPCLHSRGTKYNILNVVYFNTYQNMNNVLMNKSSFRTIDCHKWLDFDQHADNEPHDQVLGTKCYKWNPEGHEDHACPC